MVMPGFGSPFSVLANDRKLTDDELFGAFRFMVAAESKATQLYTQLAESTGNKLAIAKLKEIAIDSCFLADLPDPGAYYHEANHRQNYPCTVLANRKAMNSQDKRGCYPRVCCRQVARFTNRDLT